MVKPTDFPDFDVWGVGVDLGPSEARRRRIVRAPHRYNVEISDQPLVYFISAEPHVIADCPIKIGSSRSPVSRAYEMSAHSPFPLVVLAVCEGGVRRELKLHERFASARLHGEWFARTPEVLRMLNWLGPRAPKSYSWKDR